MSLQQERMESHDLPRNLHHLPLLLLLLLSLPTRRLCPFHTLLRPLQIEPHPFPRHHQICDEQRIPQPEHERRRVEEVCVARPGAEPEVVQEREENERVEVEGEGGEGMANVWGGGGEGRGRG